MNLFTPQKHTHTQQGFTLVELIVALAMMGILMSVVSINQRSIANSIRVKNSAYELAIALREAQSYGINVRQADGELFDDAYGIRVSTNAVSYYLYYDGNGTESYQPNEEVVIYTLTHGQKIGDMCLFDSHSSNSCISPTNGTVDILFKRPSPKAIIKRGGTTYPRVSIPITTEDGSVAVVVTVSDSGKISIDE